MMRRRPSLGSLSTVSLLSDVGTTPVHRRNVVVPMTMVTGNLPSSVNSINLNGTRILKRVQRPGSSTTSDQAQQHLEHDGGTSVGSSSYPKRKKKSNNGRVKSDESLSLPLQSDWIEGVITDVAVVEDCGASTCSGNFTMGSPSSSRSSSSSRGSPLSAAAADAAAAAETSQVLMDDMSVLGDATEVTVSTASTTAGSSNLCNRICTVVYKDGDEDIEEIIPVDENLDVWITAHFMAKICGDITSDDDDGDDGRRQGQGEKSVVGVTKLPLFTRKFRSSRSSSLPYSFEEFLHLLDYSVGSKETTESGSDGDDDDDDGCNEDDRTTTSAQLEALEGNVLVKKKSNPTEVYGRMLPKAVHKIMHGHMKLRPDHVLVDLGHGIGNSCLQAAYSFGCEARGLECHKGRNDVSKVLSLKFQDAADIHKTRDGMTFVPGPVKLRQGSLADPQHFDFLTNGVTHFFFDNWNGVFSGERLGAPNWERYVSALFASTPPGTMMTTVSPLRATLGPLPLSEANAVRISKGLPPSDDASYYELEEHVLGGKSEVYSFSEGNKSKELIRLYVYTRTQQSTGDLAVFQCNNAHCEKAKSGELVPAVTEEVGIGECGVAGARIIACCSCNVTDRVRRTKRARVSFM